jgi:LPS sulfotransferase NodH
LKKNDVKVIVLIRKNSLRNTLSDLRARSTKVYHNESGVKTDAIPKFKIDLNELGNKMQQIEGFNKQLENASAGLNRKIVYYEDFENWNNTIADLQDYLNVTQMKIEPVSKKLNPGKLEDMVENYQEMKDWLLARGYEKYLD